MSCRHRGHVSNCKAHSIHIPLQSRREGRGGQTDKQEVLVILNREELVKNQRESGFIDPDSHVPVSAGSQLRVSHDVAAQRAAVISNANLLQ